MARDSERAIEDYLFACLSEHVDSHSLRIVAEIRRRVGAHARLVGFVDEIAEALGIVDRSHPNLAAITIGCAKQHHGWAAELLKLRAIHEADTKTNMQYVDELVALGSQNARLVAALRDARYALGPLCGEATGWAQYAERAVEIIDRALGGGAQGEAGKQAKP